MLKKNGPVVPPSGRGDCPGTPLEFASSIDYDSSQVLRRPDLLDRLAVSDPHLHWLVANLYYPKGFPLGPKLRGWLESTNDAWITRQMHLRDEKGSADNSGRLQVWTPEMELIVPPQSGLRLLTLEQVIARVRIGETALWEKIRNGEFPAPIAIGTRGKRWVSHEVSNWIRERHERRCEEDPGYLFLTQRLDTIRPQRPHRSGAKKPKVSNPSTKAS